MFKGSIQRGNSAFLLFPTFLYVKQYENEIIFFITHNNSLPLTLAI